MPYSGPDDEKLPDNVKDMPTDKRKQWVAVFNDALDSCMADDGKDCEGAAMKAANGAVKEDKKEERTLIQRLIAWLKNEQEQQEEVERALSFNDLYMHTWALLQEVDSYAWLNDLYDDGNGGTFAVISSGGKLYRSEVTVTDNTVALGDMQEVVVEFVPRRRMQIVRSNGQVRALAVAGSAVLNRGGEIDSRELFDSFIEHINRTGEFPEYGFFHMWNDEERSFGDFRLGVVDWVGREGNLYLASVLFDDTELARAAIAAIEAEPDFWGNSIGFKYMSDDPACRELIDVGGGITIPVYKKGRNHEISLLPEGQAAAWFTKVEIAEERTMTEREREALLRLFGGNEAKVDEFIASAGAIDRSIQEAGLITRQQQGEGEKPESPEAPTPAPTKEGENEGKEGDEQEAPPIELDDETLGEIVAQALESPVIQALVATNEALRAEVDNLKRELSAERTQTTEKWTIAEERLSALEEDEDAKRQRWQEDMPRRTAQRVTHRPRDVHREKREEAELSYQDIAEQTLANLGAKK